MIFTTMKVLFLSVILVLISSAIHAEADSKSSSINNIVEEFKTKIDRLRIAIETIHDSLFYELDSTKFNIEKKVRDASNKIQREIDYKRLEIQGDIKTATYDNTDKKECLQNQLNYLEANITTQRISFCNPVSELVICQEILRTINQYGEDLYLINSRCVVYGMTEQSVIRCFSEQLANTDFGVKSFKSELLEILQKSKLKVDTCISNASEEISNELNSLICEAFPTEQPNTTTEKVWTTTKGTDITNICSCSCKRPIKKFKCEIVP